MTVKWGGCLLERERVRDQRGYWVGLGEGQKKGAALGAGCPREVQGGLETVEVVRSCRREVSGQGLRRPPPPQNWLGLGVSPFRLFSSWVGGV